MRGVNEFLGVIYFQLSLRLSRSTRQRPIQIVGQKFCSSPNFAEGTEKLVFGCETYSVV